MKVTEKHPLRTFKVGHEGRKITLSHVADIELEPDEQITLVGDTGSEYDVVRKNWGYYATPSLNGRLPEFGLRSALVQSGDRRYLLMVEKDRIAEFQAYLASQDMEVIVWLDGDEIEWPRPD